VVLRVEKAVRFAVRNSQMWFSGSGLGFRVQGVGVKVGSHLCCIHS
jgi:hypothetical protein